MSDESVNRQAADPKGPTAPLDGANPSVRSILVSVRDLEASVEFYRDVLSLEEVFREDQIVVLGSNARNSFELVLRKASRVAARTDEGLGLRTASFDVGSFDELESVERRLRARQAFRDVGTVNPEGVYKYVRGYDPDRQALIFLAFAPGMQFSDEFYRQFAGFLYSVDT
jgi:catechol 2,3-dioxygenase-like lactoylglutathione lyase family enzyme